MIKLTKKFQFFVFIDLLQLNLMYTIFFSRYNGKGNRAFLNLFYRIFFFIYNKLKRTNDFRAGLINNFFFTFSLKTFFVLFFYDFSFMILQQLINDINNNYFFFTLLNQNIQFVFIVHHE